MTLEVFTYNKWKAAANAAIIEEWDQSVEDLYQINLGWMAEYLSRSGLNDIKIYKFAETPRISPYLWTLNVGHYIVTNCEDYRYPIRLLTRRGQSHVESINLCFDICKKTIDFFEHIFGQVYPFQKLDLVLCPMVRYTAMESVGCIVFSENMMGSQRYENLTRGAIMNSTITIMHEISHQWFGNMVTMQWWNDLWLNESFATFISHLAYEHLIE